jgi:broad specificity phosphatase PhoE
MPRLYLVRHAEPTLAGVLLGRIDAPLSPAGRRQAADAWGDRELPAAVYSSPLRCALETAELLTPVPARVAGELAEIGYGEWDGKTWAEIERLTPGLAAVKQKDWFGVTPRGGEPWAGFRHRVRRAWDIVHAGPWPCAVVAHAAVNGVLAELAGGASVLSFRQEYGEVIRIDV